MEPKLYPPKASKLIIGVNDLETLYPHIAKELVNIDASTILATSTKKVKWTCTYCKENWECAPKSRVAHIRPTIGCPKCSSKKGIKMRGNKMTLRAVYPELVEEMVDPSLANKLTYSSHTEVEWKCKKADHTYIASINKRVYGRTCSYCTFRDILIGYNNIGAVRPDLVPELANEENINIIANSRDKIRWYHFSNDGIKHEWEASPKDRLYNNYGCLICAGKKVQIGVNDFKSQFLDKSGLKWSTNNKFNPEDISLGSKQKVELICDKHNELNYMTMEAKFFTRGDRICQDCIPTNMRYRSKAEAEISETIKSIFNCVVEENVKRFRSYGVHDIDILVNNKVAIEFNGTYWHQEGVYKPVGYHVNKKKLIEELGFTLINVEESDWSEDKDAVLKNIVAEIAHALF